MAISDTVRKELLRFQKSEITEHHIYSKLSVVIKDENNRKVLADIAADELRHYNKWKEYTKRDVKPDGFKIFFYVLLSRLFGLTFGVKLMERGEQNAKASYAVLTEEIPEAEAIGLEEDRHENALLQLLDEELLRYTGSMILGLNDALVELTGALAGFTLALQDSKMVALTGSITGFAAALSMASSEYLSTKSESTDKNPVKASFYTGMAYIFTVIILIAPYLLISNLIIALGTTLASAILIIAIFNFYTSVANDIPFKSRFFEMAGISLGVSLLSFGVGFLLRYFFNIDV
ncbi:MAG: VIT1/CCC1 transporter family protein [Fibrobacter sp.]|nr:VIT1/CCC1 transporter family protein [Fibrobacter sp.]